MVCPRCIEAIKNALDEEGIAWSKVELGQVSLNQELTEAERFSFDQRIRKQGFELLESQSARLISSIKTTIISRIHKGLENMDRNFSEYLSGELHYDYSHLSKLFSSVEGITIEKYITLQKIERVKELLFYDELTLSEIAYQLNYSSVAHLSGQFKKETGMTATEFKNREKPGLRPLDSI